MGFTTPCYIKKNTKEIRNELEKLGYTFVPNGYGEWNVPIERCKYLNCSSDTINKKAFYYYIGRMCKPNYGIDCGTNEELFIALAALRDDTDKFQLFTDGDKWILCPEIKFSAYWVYNDIDVNIDTIHKATVNELIEHFKV